MGSTRAPAAWPGKDRTPLSDVPAALSSALCVPGHQGAAVSLCPAGCQSRSPEPPKGIEGSRSAMNQYSGTESGLADEKPHSPHPCMENGI